MNEVMTGVIAEARKEGRRAGLLEAAKIAEADRADECVYTTDKPGDPTWTHNDDDTCPKCGGCPANGTDLAKCVGTARNRIATAIRALAEGDGA